MKTFLLTIELLTLVKCSRRLLQLNSFFRCDDLGLWHRHCTQGREIEPLDSEAL